MNWTPQNPGAGEPTGIRYLAGLRTAKANAFRDVAATLRDVQQQATSVDWKARSRDAFVGKVDGVFPDLTVIAEGLEAQAAALNKYAARVEQIKAQHTALKTQQATLLHNLTNSYAQLDRLDATVLPAHLRVLPLEGARPNPTDSPETARARAKILTGIESNKSATKQSDQGLHDLVQARQAADNACAAALNGQSVLGATWKLSTATIRGGSSSELLSLLKGLSVSDLRVLLTLHPELGDKLAKADDPKAVAAWWNSYADPRHPTTPTAQQLALVALIPSALGNLEGVAYWARSSANRWVLEGAIAQREGLGSRRNADLMAIRKALGDPALRPPRYLISLQVDSMPQPLAAIAVGNLDTAKHATFQVSGMFSSTGSMVDSVADATHLQASETYLAKQLGMSGGSAVVSWIGYDSPDLVSVLGQGHADAGALQFADAIAGYRATTGGMNSGNYLVIDAHSYGTTTVMTALHNQDLGVDALAMYGSAGEPPGVSSASDLHVPSGNTWVGETDTDSLAPLGRSGSRRGDPDLWTDATDFGTNGDVIDPLTHQRLLGSSGHSQYLKQDSESLRNLAVIGIGRGDLVLSATPSTVGASW